MKPSCRFSLPAVGATLLVFSSCGTMKELGSATGGGIGKGFDRVAQVARDPFGPRIPIVEAREKDLREAPSGHEQAIAFERRRRGFWIFDGPVDFTEPELPDEDAFADGGLLPPIE